MDTVWVSAAHHRQCHKDGTATPMIIVMPDANTGQRGYYNSINRDGTSRICFLRKLIPYVEKTYYIKGEKRFRAVARLSMAGAVPLCTALHHPELFSSACPISAYVGPLSLNDLKKRMEKNKEKYSDKTLQQYYEQYNALSLIDEMTQDQLQSVRWYIDCGDDDFLHEGNSLVHIALRKKDVSHEYRVKDGHHSWTYWHASLPKVLEFVSDTFHQY